jgi:hypothetical protein
MQIILGMYVRVRLISSLTIFISLVGSITSVFASNEDPYDSGYNHGCDDADLDAEDRYINEPGKGPSHHTERFMDGYNDGFDACGDNNSNSGSDSDFIGRNFGESGDESGECYYDGVLNWGKACNDLDNFISEPCDDLVTSDGLALTAEGKEVLERVACQGGALVSAVLTSNVIALLGAASC